MRCENCQGKGAFLKVFLSIHRRKSHIKTEVLKGIWLPILFFTELKSKVHEPK